MLKRTVCSWVAAVYISNRSGESLYPPDTWTVPDAVRSRPFDTRKTLFYVRGGDPGFNAFSRCVRALRRPAKVQGPHALMSPNRGTNAFGLRLAKVQTSSLALSWLR